MKARFKALANLGCSLAMLPIAGSWLVLRWLTRSDLGFATLNQTMSLIPGRPGIYLRRAFYGWCLPRFGEDCEVGFGTLLTSPQTTMEDRVYIGPYCVLGAVDIECDALIASHVSILNGGHQHGSARLDAPMREQPGAFPRVKIGAGSWLGERSIVMCNVGRHCIVGAGAVVTAPLPDFAVAMGVPARIVRFRNEVRTDALELPRPQSVVMN